MEKNRRAVVQGNSTELEFVRNNCGLSSVTVKEEILKIDNSFGSVTEH